MMNKNFKILLLSAIALFSISTPALASKETLTLNKLSIENSNKNRNVEVYSITTNRHGRILRTSVGTFYLGKSGDAIHQVSRNKRYGYWNGSIRKVRVYIDDNVYTFYFN